MKKLVAIPGVVLFFVSCAGVRGGLFDSARYGDAAYYGPYAHLRDPDQAPSPDFYAAYPLPAPPLFRGGGAGRGPLAGGELGVLANQLR